MDRRKSESAIERRFRLLVMAGLLIEIAGASVLSGCGSKPQDNAALVSAPVLPPSSLSSGIADPKIVDAPGTQGFQPKSMSQQLNDPNVPASVKAMIQGHMHENP